MKQLFNPEATVSKPQKLSLRRRLGYQVRSIDLVGTQGLNRDFGEPLDFHGFRGFLRNKNKNEQHVL